MRILRLPLLALALSIVTLASEARAATTIKDSSTHTRPQQIDAVALLNFFGTYNHFGLGVWYGYPIVPDGFIPALNDALFIEVGAAIERYSWDYSFLYSCSYSWYRLSPLGGVRYSFYLNDEWTVYATAKAGYGVGFGDKYQCGGYTGSVSSGVSYSQFIVDFGAGAYWSFSDAYSMRFDLGYFGLGAGAGMQL